MRKRLVLVRHGDDPPDDRVVTFAVENGFTADIRRPYKGETLASAADDDVAGAVLYGGPFNADDEETHPFLRAEAALIDRLMAADKPVLGLCQGAQQIARVLGATVGPLPGAPYEFGYYPITPTAAGREDGFLDGPMVVSQAHFHAFELPLGAIKLATSEAFPNQAFRIGASTYGLQFHPEVTIEGFRRWQRAPWAPFGKPGAQTQDAQNQLMAAHDAAQADWFYAFLARLFGRAG